MKAKQQLESLLALFERSRRSGCTEAMLNGAANSKCIVVAHNQSAANAMRDQSPLGVVLSLQTAVQSHYPEGVAPSPILLDNAATIQILRLAIEEITIQENRVRKAQRLAHEIASI